ncbi:MAG: Rid family hydrolase [Micropepsaceae bacterium]
MGDVSYERTASRRADRKIAFLSFPVSDGDRTWTCAGILSIPAAAPLPAPAVIVVHGSNGIDSRGEGATDALNAAGVATFEIDLWAAHGVAGPETRPKSPFETVPDVFAALAVLAARPEIDEARIGLSGFSWGGLMTMLAATRAIQGKYAAAGARFAAFAPFYPVAWIYNAVPGFDFRDLTGPVLIQLGAADTYDDPDTGDALLATLSAADRANVTLHVHPGATHAWDRREPDITVHDPFSHKGKGGPTLFAYDAATARRATGLMTDFFTAAFGIAAPAAPRGFVKPFADARRVGDILFLSGDIGLDPETGKLAPGGIEPETRQAFRNISATLARHGLTLSDIVKCTVMLDDMAEWGAFNAVYLTFLDKDALPARSAFGTSGLALGARMEIECIARYPAAG